MIELQLHFRKSLRYTAGKLQTHKQTVSFGKWMLHIVPKLVSRFIYTADSGNTIYST